jgi:large subunit ribosomal protein L24e
MVNCSFCGKEIKKGSGKKFVRDNGQILNFCSSKCEKNMLGLKRDSRKFKWTKSFEKGTAKIKKPKK